jgi:hypothetical protein
VRENALGVVLAPGFAAADLDLLLRAAGAGTTPRLDRAPVEASLREDVVREIGVFCAGRASHPRLHARGA